MSIAIAFLTTPAMVPSGAPGLDLVHLPTWTSDDGLPFDGRWSVIIVGRDIAVQRCAFRTFHAALHYAVRIKDLADWTKADLELLKDEDGPVLSVALRHAEAHAHELDAVAPPGSIMPFSNGPSLVDHTGDLRKYLARAPHIEWENEGGIHRCSVCGDEPKIRFEWMDQG